MPSIMDLVREYSELEMRRNERGGILEPQLEIRYQALKFFLEFELFPTPTIKSTEQPRHYERKVISHSSEIKRPTDTKTEEEQKNAKIGTANLQNPEPTHTIDNKAQELASIISETTLPVSEPSEASILSEEKIETTNTETYNVPTSDVTSDEKITTPFNKEEVLDMVEAIDEAVENIVIPDTPQTETVTPQEQVNISEQASSTDYITPEKLADETVNNIDLLTQTNETFNNIAKIEDTTRATDQVVLENVLPEFPNLVQETHPPVIEQVNDNLPSIEQINDNLPSIEQTNDNLPSIEQTNDILPTEEKLSDLQSSQDIQTLPINIEEVINVPLPSQEQNQAEIPSQPIINIDEIVNKITSAEIPTQKPQDNTSNIPQIDFLSGIDISSPIPTKPVESQTPNTSQSPISIEEILPSDFIIPEAPASQVSSDRTFIETPVKAAIHLIDGDARRGIIKDLKESHSKVELFEDESLKNSTKIDISEIKAIFVLKQTTEKISEVSGKKLNIRFKDERSISGISPDYSENSSVFTLFPIEGTQSAKMIIIYRGFIDQVEEI